MANLKTTTAKKPSQNDIINGLNSLKNNDLVGKRYASQAAAQYAAQQKKLQDQEMARQAASYAAHAQQSQASKNALTNDLMGQRYQGQAEQDFSNALARLGNQPPVGPQNPPTGGSPSGGSSGGGSSSTTPEDPLAAIQAMTGTIDPSLRSLVPTSGELEVMYNRLKGDIESNKTNLDKNYQESINAIGSNFGKSNSLIQNAISGDQDTLAKAAAALGVQGWDSGATATGNTAMLNDLLGVNSSNQATDLSWFEKMRNLDSSQFNTSLEINNAAKQSAIEASNQTMLQLQEAANQMAQAQALQELLGGGGSGGGGGGGGRRFGGGSGGSSGTGAYKSLSETGSETQDQKNVQIAEALDAIAQTNPGLADWAWQQWFTGGHDTGAAISNAYKQRDALANLGTTNYKIDAYNAALGKIFGPKAQKQMPVGYGSSADDWNWLINTFMNADETAGTAVSRNYDTKSTQTTKVQNVPTVPQNWANGAKNTSLGGLAKAFTVPKKTTPKPKTPKKPSAQAKSAVHKVF